jgi:thiol-disulfide isomerase/thioredoxin
VKVGHTATVTASKRISGLSLLLLVTTASCGVSARTPQGQASPETMGWSDVEPREVTWPTGGPINGSRESKGGSDAVLINFWASTCGPCREEMSLLDDVDREPGIAVVGVTRDMFEKNAAKLISEEDIDFPSWMDSSGDYMQGFSDLVPHYALPSSVLVVDGQAVAAHIGPFDTSDEVLEKVRQHAGGE